MFARSSRPRKQVDEVPQPALPVLVGLACRDALLQDVLGRSQLAHSEPRPWHRFAEQDRVVELDETIRLTLEFMEQAQERAYRTIAPRLKDAIEKELPGITGGRYIEATVDPESLDVKVWGNGGAPRQAHVLSFGTAEQIYLLLRIALAEHLVTNGRSCPLILDDVTVHADSQRTLRILELLLAESERRQIIVFTQQEQVREWARQRLTDGPHALRELLPVTTV